MLDLHLPLMLFVLVLFLVLLVVLNNMLFKPLITFMDDRKSSIDKDLEAAKNVNSNIDEINNQIDEILQHAKAKATSIKMKAIEDEKTVAVSRVETKQQELDTMYEKFLGELATSKENLKNELMSQMPLFKESLKAKFSKL
jgi:F-type H+-transporting ATPase subunit b